MSRLSQTPWCCVLFICKLFKGVNDHISSSIFDGFEEQEAILSHIEVNVVFGFIGDIWAEIPADECVPVSIVFTVEFVFEVGRYLLDSMHFFEGIFGDSDDLSLHLRANIFCFDDWFMLANLGH